MSTLFETVYLAFFKRIENDPDFFNYYNLFAEEALALAKERANGYLKDAISKLTLLCTSDVDFNDYNDELATFNFELTNNEIFILACLMFEFYLERDICKLKVFETILTSQDIKQVASPANERKTFYDMFDKVKINNETLVTNYSSRDRITLKRKKINHALYDQEV